MRLPPPEEAVNYQGVFTAEHEAVQKHSFPGCKIHGFFMNEALNDEPGIIMLLELDDNSMSMQRLTVSEDEGKPCKTVLMRDVIDRELEVKDDPIVKFRQVIDTIDIPHGIALRKSGHIDLYYNYQRVAST